MKNMDLYQIKGEPIRKALLQNAFSLQSCFDNIFPIFRLRVKAFKEINPVFFLNEEENIVKTTLLAQDVLKTSQQTGFARIFEEQKTMMWGDLDYDKLFSLANKYDFEVESSSHPEFLVSLDLARGFIADRNKGIVDIKGNIIKPKSFPHSLVMTIPHKSDNNGIPLNAKKIWQDIASDKQNHNKFRM